jgi:hypothetical protein
MKMVIDRAEHHPLSRTAIGYVAKLATSPNTEHLVRPIWPLGSRETGGDMTNARSIGQAIQTAVD